jgi:hypothetical protein
VKEEDEPKSERDFEELHLYSFVFDRNSEKRKPLNEVGHGAIFDRDCCSLYRPLG